MGQLERYGLYVLVLVIFLILGVAMWGDAPDPAYASSGEPGTAARLDAQQKSALEKFSEALENGGGFEFAGLQDRTPATPGPAAAGGGGASGEVAEGGEQAAEPVSPPPQPALRTYKIKKRDTFDSIARGLLRGAVTWQDIEAANPGVDPNKLRPGQEINLPDGAAAPIASATGSAPSGARHTVKKGDNPATISKRYFGTERMSRRIMEANGISDPTKLKIGQVLIIPN